MATYIVQTQSSGEYVANLDGNYTLPPVYQRDRLTLKNTTASDITITAYSGQTVDGDSSFTLGGYCARTLVRGRNSAADVEWTAVSGFDKLETSDTDDGSVTTTVASGITTIQATGDSANFINKEGTYTVAGVSSNASLDTTTSAGIAYTNQPSNDSIDVLSDDAGDTTQTVTIIGTTTGTDTVVVETISLNGTTAVTSTKTNWGVILAVKLSASCAGTVTVRESSADQSITTILTTVLSSGVETVSAADIYMYNRKVSLVADGSTTKQIGLKGTNDSDAVIYDSQALNGTTAVLSNSDFRTLTEIYTGDLEATRTATAANDATLDIGGIANFTDTTEATTAGAASVTTAGGIYAAKKVITASDIVSTSATGSVTLGTATETVAFAVTAAGAGTITPKSGQNVTIGNGAGGLVSSGTGTSSYAGPLSMTGDYTSTQGDITLTEGKVTTADLSGPAVLDTAIADGGNFGNQPANDGVTVVSDDAGDTTQTVTIIGTTNGTDTVVVEDIALTGDTPANSVKVDWGIILAVKLSASCDGTVTIKETSGSATITTIATTVLSAGVTTVSGADQIAYGRKIFLVAGGASTKQIGIKGTNTSAATVYDSQALDGTTPVQSNTLFSTVTELYHGDLASGSSVTQSSDARIIIPTIGINVANLPTSATGLQIGDIYVDTGALKVVTA